MHRWIARLLILVMVVPAIGPVAMAWPAQREAPHCLRQPAKPVMQCHHGMAMAAEPQPSEASFRTVSQCCLNHDCCCRVAAQQWAQPQARLSSHGSLPTEKAPSAPGPQLTPITPADNDSARAPPRS